MLPKRCRDDTIIVIMQAPFKDIGVVYQLMEQIRGELVEESYDNVGNAAVVIKLEKRLHEKFKNGLLDRTGGQVEAETL